MGQRRLFWQVVAMFAIPMIGGMALLVFWPF